MLALLLPPVADRRQFKGITVNRLPPVCIVEAAAAAAAAANYQLLMPSSSR